MHAGSHQPVLFCFCAPVASGKSTIVRLLEQSDARLMRSISTTTRPPREGEQEGRHYYFVEREEFERRIAAGAFIEYAQVGLHFYGTERSVFETADREGKDLILAIDVQGVQALKETALERVVTVFVFPPSFAELKRRLGQRGDPKDVQERRLRIAREEVSVLSAAGFSDYFLVNDDLEKAVSGARAIISAERLRYSRQKKDFLGTVLTLA